jgi:8-oxo-dGTP pyrophosphatase MutT (NUDIX family)
MANGYDVRCSVIVLRRQEVLLVHRTHDGLDDWVLPGGTPREGESVRRSARKTTPMIASRARHLYASRLEDTAAGAGVLSSSSQPPSW